jgi:hypothetical protein
MVMIANLTINDGDYSGFNHLKMEETAPTSFMGGSENGIKSPHLWIMITPQK